MRTLFSSVITTLSIVGIITSCQQNPNKKDTEDSTSIVRRAEEPTLVNKIKGSWTDSTAAFAAIEIGTDSIYYAEHSTSYPYKLEGDSITINFFDSIFKGKVLFKGDTLVMVSEDFGETKFIHFKK